ncbi:MAG: signal recognition particle-docking protein FtsY [Alphaproteobacteria bacterium]|nr:signal recognition particle-docking protein FtsY [Alphaproteobacteria bacterium]
MFKLFHRTKTEQPVKNSTVETSVQLDTTETANEPAGFLSRLKSGLGKSAGKLSSGIADIFTKRKLDKEALDDLEDLLIISDMGVKTASDIVQALSAAKFEKDISPEEVKHFLADKITDLLTPVAKPLHINPQHRPHVVLVAGVNGNGKTTTIGKLASYYQQQGLSVMMAACDTFRAAAVGQLEVWANRVGCPIVMGAEAADPASVAFQALEKAKLEGIDVLLVDTAGRLHTKSNLMEQLGKMVRVIKKLDASAPHHTVLVLDATTGQNAHQQVKEFQSAIAVDGLIVTKLDGTAKGGVVVSLAREFGINLYAIGVGEGIDDLRPFEARAFAENLVGL